MLQAEEDDLKRQEVHGLGSSIDHRAGAGVPNENLLAPVGRAGFGELFFRLSNAGIILFIRFKCAARRHDLP
jgi:hypothetical protein